ncbi:helix-turn-helix transcriptional regulator [Sinorhizobium psoraleae]|uniref:PAS domain-containing protein n=1 Tax=Sinorhizobium psoraleae TaxID=520838 RepID=A0ABT4KM01_9HYPH|nr:PAS domain-containing protein [Sinorhizobium psoraleae]MCZ4092993.1 PAS domain-containing protein [Sinorhizobium psoraleae]
MNIEPTIPFSLAMHAPSAAAISALLYPHAEVVLHDLATGRIAGIWNAFSGRAAGMESLIEEEFGKGPGNETVLGPYEKVGPDGRRLKSVSAVLRHAEGSAAGLLCINLDVSRIDDAVKLLAAFAGTPEPRPQALFSRDWREEINAALHGWLRARGLALSAMKRADRVALVAALEEQGLFKTRNAVDHLASLIGASRASIYNYLAAARRGGAV